MACVSTGGGKGGGKGGGRRTIGGIPANRLPKGTTFTPARRGGRR